MMRSRASAHPRQQRPISTQPSTARTLRQRMPLMSRRCEGSRRRPFSQIDEVSSSGDDSARREPIAFAAALVRARAHSKVAFFRSRIAATMPVL